MSGAFEAAAGAFAVVGVADVLVRTGRELYNFLHEVADAPEELTHLREAIRDTLLLYQTSKRCHDDLKRQAASKSSGCAVLSLDSANRALNRELQSLKLLIAKFKGTKTWSRVKFVLNEAKVKKATDKIEHAKNLLASSLTLACSELSALGDANIETVVRQTLEETGLRIDDLLQALDTKLDAQHQTQLSAQSDYQQAIITKLDTTQQQLLKTCNSHDQSFKSVQRTQVDIVSRQETTTRIVQRTQKQTHAILRTLNRADMRAANASKTTNDSLEKLSAAVDQLLHLKNDSAQARKSGRDIFFLGERQDQILAYLLPLQNDLDFAITYLMSQHGDEISASDAEWLRSEFEHLIGSATQEKAVQYSNSTATSVDDWSYPEDTVGYLRSATRHRNARVPRAVTNSQDSNGRGRSDWSRVRSKRSQQTWLIPTNSGEMEISLPNHRKPGKDPQYLDQVGFCCKLEQNRTTFTISARFLRDLTYASRPRICAQLNVFIEVDEVVADKYVDIIHAATLSEFDAALRSGEISPFHLGNNGMSLCFTAAIVLDRTDILKYLETQGVGHTALNPDPTLTSVVLVTYDTNNQKIATLECLLSSASEPSSFALQLALYLLLIREGEGSYHTIWSLVVVCLETLLKEGFSTAKKDRMLDCFSSRDLNRPCISIPHLVLVLLDADEYECESVFELKGEILALIEAFLNSRCVEHYSYADSVDILSMLIGKGFGIDDAAPDSITPSAYARCRDRWDMWCEALERNDKKIEEVVRVEGNEWLLNDNWQEVWIARRYPDWERLNQHKSEE